MSFHWKIAAAAAALAASVGAAGAQGTLKAVMHSDVKIVDPIWTTAYITRNHGYMIYDTLFAMDEKGEIKPQMVDKYDESADKLTYTFTLRDGLVWHDGPPVTAEDCIASIKRWSARDALGQKLMSFVDSMTANDAKTFTVKLKSPTGLLIFGLGKPSSNVPFMMPKRVADTDPNTQISEFIGSGPFVFKRDEWKPGDKAVYVKFDKYKPRSEPASGMSGGKVVKLDRVEWLAIADQQQALNALLAGEIDYYEQPPIDLLPLLKGDSNVKLVNYNPLGLQYTFRPNHLQKPFDNPKVRQALFYAFNQKDFLDATIGNPEYYKVCKAMFVCGNPLASEKGMEGLLESNFAKSRELLAKVKESGIKVVLATSSDKEDVTTYKRITGIEDLVDAVASGSDAKESKPEPDIFAVALKKINLGADRAVALGDTPYDAEAAGKLGIRVIGLTCGGWKRDDRRDAGCVEVYQDPADLLLHFADSLFARG